MPPTVDLTLPMQPAETQWEEPGQSPRAQPVLRTRTWHLPATPRPYRARVHFFSFWSMAGTYIDLPGHIVETDDGQDAATFPATALFRLPAAVARLDRTARPGPVDAPDLAAACTFTGATPGLVVNALGPARFDAIPERSVYLTRAAVEWVIARGTRLLVSDVYESNTHPQDVFRTLFRAGVATVCHPADLGQLASPWVRLTALPLRIPGATQLPCRLLAEDEPPGFPPGLSPPAAPQTQPLPTEEPR